MTPRAPTAARCDDYVDFERGQLADDDGHEPAGGRRSESPRRSFDQRQERCFTLRRNELKSASEADSDWLNAACAEEAVLDPTLVLLSVSRKEAFYEPPGYRKMTSTMAHVSNSETRRLGGNVE